MKRETSLVESGLNYIVGKVHQRAKKRDKFVISMVTGCARTQKQKRSVLSRWIVHSNVRQEK